MLNKKTITKSRKAFTLIEILIIVFIIAILVSVILVTLNIARTRAKDSSFKTTAHSIQTALTSCCITSTTLTNPPAPGGTICPTSSERYPGAESMGGGSIDSGGCNSGNFIVTINTGTKNSGTYTSATIRSDSITYNN